MYRKDKNNPQIMAYRSKYILVVVKYLYSNSSFELKNSTPPTTPLPPTPTPRSLIKTDASVRVKTLFLISENLLNKN